jgi:hypothetical protein
LRRPLGGRMLGDVARLHCWIFSRWQGDERSENNCSSRVRIVTVKAKNFNGYGFSGTTRLNGKFTRSVSVSGGLLPTTRCSDRRARHPSHRAWGPP